MEQGRRRRSGGGLGSTALREEGEKEEGGTGSGFPAAARAEVARGGLATAAVDGDRGGATTELGGGPELGEKGKGGKGVLSPTLARAGAQRGGELRGGWRPIGGGNGGGGARGWSGG